MLHQKGRAMNTAPCHPLIKKITFNICSNINMTVTKHQPTDARAMEYREGVLIFTGGGGGTSGLHLTQKAQITCGLGAVRRLVGRPSKLTSQ